MRQQGVEEAMGIRTERQAEEGAVGVQTVATSLRSAGIGVTESSLTTGVRADRASTTGSLAGDEFFETDTQWRYRWTGTAWAFETGFYMATEATRGGLTVTAEDNGAVFFATDTLILWQVAGGAWVKRLEVKGTANQIAAGVAAGVLTLSLVASPDVTTSFKVGGSQIIGARKTGWTLPTSTQTRNVADYSALTLTQLAEVVAALVNDVHADGGTQQKLLST